MPDRMGPLRTVTGRFVEAANGGLISQGAVVVPAAESGFENVPLGVFEGAPTAPGDLVSVVVPSGVAGREIKITWDVSVPLSKTIVLVPGEAIDADELTVSSDASVGIDRVVDLADLLPAQSWVPNGDGGSPGQGWLTTQAEIEKIEIAVEKVERGRQALVSTGERPWSEVFGVAKADVSGRAPDPAETFDPTHSLVALTGDALAAAWPERVTEPPESFDFHGAAPRPAPMGGVSFGLAVLSTPSAKVAGKSANPLAHISTSDLFDRKETQNLLSQAGFGEDVSLELAAGPEQVTPTDGPATTTLLGTEADIESFVGILGGDAAGWGIGLHVVRADVEDNVIVVGLHRHAVGTGEGAMDRLRQDDAIVQARTLVAETARQLTSS